MSEADAIRSQGAPHTVESLATDLRLLGLLPGATVLVHSSLSALGWVNGGAQAVVQALEKVLTPQGTLVMPTHSGGLSDPSFWNHPPVPESWWPEIRRSMPVFDPLLTPTRGMGTIPETFRHQKGVVRSRHPQVSFAAWGKQKHEVVRDHNWDWPLGLESPLARLRNLGGWVLLLGVGHDRNTSLHLAETLAKWPGRVEIKEPAPWQRSRNRTLWKPVINVGYQDEDFPQIGAAFEAALPDSVRRGRVGSAEAVLLDQACLVDFAVGWMETHR